MKIWINQILIEGSEELIVGFKVLVVEEDEATVRYTYI